MSRFKPFWRWVGWLIVAGVALQLFFLARVALMVWIDPQSTAFQRSEFWQIASSPAPLRWRQTWQPYERISDALKRAVVASEDDSFLYHDGVEWDAIEKAWQKNAQQQEGNSDQQRAQRKGRPAKIYGGSTITQQLAKNLLLSGER
ncbi:MAG: transglycosylase domain-containing protein, partial [Burkholderiales bacterium]